MHIHDINKHTTTVKSFNFEGTQLNWLTTMDMLVDICEFQIILNITKRWINISFGIKFVDCPSLEIHL